MERNGRRGKESSGVRLGSVQLRSSNCLYPITESTTMTEFEPPCPSYLTIHRDRPLMENERIGRAVKGRSLKKKDLRVKRYPSGSRRFSV